MALKNRKVYLERASACNCCGKGMSDPFSISVGIGPECLTMIGIDRNKALEAVRVGGGSCVFSAKASDEDWSKFQKKFSDQRIVQFSEVISNIWKDHKEDPLVAIKKMNDAFDDKLKHAKLDVVVSNSRGQKIQSVLYKIEAKLKDGQKLTYRSSNDFMNSLRELTRYKKAEDELHDLYLKTKRITYGEGSAMCSVWTGGEPKYMMGVARRLFSAFADRIGTEDDLEAVLRSNEFKAMSKCFNKKEIDELKNSLIEAAKSKKEQKERYDKSVSDAKSTIKKYVDDVSGANDDDLVELHQAIVNGEPSRNYRAQVSETIASICKDNPSKAKELYNLAFAKSKSPGTEGILDRKVSGYKSQFREDCENAAKMFSVSDDKREELFKSIESGRMISFANKHQDVEALAKSVATSASILGISDSPEFAKLFDAGFWDGDWGTKQKVVYKHMKTLNPMWKLKK